MKSHQITQHNNNRSITVIGIDIGTTEMKFSSVLQNGKVINLRVSTPACLRIESRDLFVFSPEDIWEKLKAGLDTMCSRYFLKYILISIVCQAPSVCVWSDENKAVGVSYLSHYGEPAKNDRNERKRKIEKRVKDADAMTHSAQNRYLSGLTGYLVYKLTGELTVDAVTAWEFGIESEEELKKFSYRINHPNCALQPKAFG